jgi:hypothetical protein
MKPEDQNKEPESPVIDSLAEKIKKRERKKKRQMDVSGKSVFKERELRIKNQELGKKNDENKPDS